MTEKSAFFRARRKVGPPDASPQTVAVHRACERIQIDPDLRWKRRPSGECQLKGDDPFPYVGCSAVAQR